MPINRNSKRICGRKTTTDPTPFQTPSMISDFSRPSGNREPMYAPEFSISCLDQFHRRLGAREDGLEYGHHDDAENDRSPERMQEHGIQAASPGRRRRSLIGGLRSDLRGPLPALRHVLKDRQLHQGLGRV